MNPNFVARVKASHFKSCHLNSVEYIRFLENSFSLDHKSRKKEKKQFKKSRE